jgi:quinol monooxygenase YgiN
MERDPMLIVRGSVTARPDAFERVRELSLGHVLRSRAEPGCISHEVSVDCENPLRFVFFERWADRAALDAHFKVPESIGFIRGLRDLVSATEGPEIYETPELPTT